MTKRRLTDNEYAAMAADYEAHPPTADEVLSVEVNQETLEARLSLAAAEAEAGEADQTDRPLPPHVSVSRPNQTRS